MEHNEVVSRLKTIHENAKALAICGESSIEPRAAEIMAISWSLLWAETPFETTDTLIEYE